MRLVRVLSLTFHWHQVTIALSDMMIAPIHLMLGVWFVATFFGTAKF